MGKWTRRAVIGAGGLVGGGLVLGVGGVWLAPNRLGVKPDTADAGAQLATWVEILPSGEVIAIVPHCEMGQGAQLGLAMMLADELGADFGRVRIHEAPADPVYANGYILRGFAEEGGMPVPPWIERALDYGTYKVADLASLQFTGGSASIRSTGRFGMRVAGAAAREMLVAAAASAWQVAAGECVAENSAVTHPPSGRRAGFGELADAAATLPLPARPRLKARDERRIVGTSPPRPDLPTMVDGTARYAIDVELPDMLHATIAAAPVPGGRLESVDALPARSMPGVEAVVELDDAVAVVASGFWQAKQALAALEPKFSDTDHAAMTIENHYAALRAALDGEGARRERDSTIVAADYLVPYLAHATMEPMSATARLADGRLELWAGTQDPLNARHVAASVSGIPFERVTMHNLPLGGGFGRRLPGAFDYIEQAVRIAMTVAPSPVKLIWTREEDMRHDFYRPAVAAELSARVDAMGRPLDWSSRFTGASIMDQQAATPIYAVAEHDLSAVMPPEYLRTGYWRSVEYSQHGFFNESFVDELAHAAGADPYVYRRTLLSAKPRHLAVIDLVADMSQWGRAPSEGRALGLAVVEAFGTIIGEVAEVSVADNGGIHVHRIWAAVDCGEVIHPDQAEAQIQGAIVFGLSAALLQEITLEAGAVAEGNFPSFDMIRLANVPRIDVQFIESGAEPGGLGEPGVPPVAPAVANAVFALTGKRLRKLPLRLDSAA